MPMNKYTHNSNSLQLLKEINCVFVFMPPLLISYILICLSSSLIVYLFFCLTYGIILGFWIHNEKYSVEDLINQYQ